MNNHIPQICIRAFQVNYGVVFNTLSCEAANIGNALSLGPSYHSVTTSYLMPKLTSKPNQWLDITGVTTVFTYISR